MLSEWSAECGADDPVLVVPWSSSESELPEGVASQPHSEFIDLRENPYDLDHLPEAEQYPPLMQALRAPERRTFAGLHRQVRCVGDHR